MATFRSALRFTMLRLDVWNERTKGGLVRQLFIFVSSRKCRQLKMREMLSQSGKTM